MKHASTLRTEISGRMSLTSLMLKSPGLQLRNAYGC